MASPNAQTPKPPKITKKKKEDSKYDDIKLEDPTSVSLMNSYLITNSGATFDNYLNTLKQQRRGTKINQGMF
jgi:hypothetical protein